MLEMPCSSLTFPWLRKHDVFIWQQYLHFIVFWILLYKWRKEVGLDLFFPQQLINSMKVNYPNSDFNF